VPKVSPEHAEARRAEILDGARRAFSRWGYEGATVARLEAETGLSRGAIFHYFPDKLAIFVALAAETNRRFIDLLLEQGLDQAIREMANESPEWLGVLIEVESALRNDETFVKRLVEAHEPQQDRILGWFEEEQRAGRLRDDVDVLNLGRFATLVVNGLALRIAAEDPVEVESVIKLLNDALRKR
jgi:TetR/AcrR family transcriptional regulator, transcriptional repressor of aconitase